jgi:hypothetical protein
VSTCAADGEHELPRNTEALSDALETAGEAGLEAAGGRQRLGRPERGAREAGERGGERAAGLDASAAGGAAAFGGAPPAFGGAAIFRAAAAVFGGGTALLGGAVASALPRGCVGGPLDRTALRLNCVRHGDWSAAGPDRGMRFRWRGSEASGWVGRRLA